MTTVPIHEAKIQLSKLIARARGQEPNAKLTALKRSDKRRVFGAMAGAFAPIPDDFFFDPLPEDELKAWESDSGRA